MIAFSTFLLSCIDYSLIPSSGTGRLEDVIVDRCLTKYVCKSILLLIDRPSFAHLLFTIIFSAFYIFQLASFAFSVPRLLDLYRFYTHLLGVPDVRPRVEGFTDHLGRRPNHAVARNRQVDWWDSKAQPNYFPCRRRRCTQSVSGHGVVSWIHDRQAGCSRCCQVGLSRLCEQADGCQPYLETGELSHRVVQQRLARPSCQDPNPAAGYPLCSAGTHRTTSIDHSISSCRHDQRRRASKILKLRSQYPHQSFGVESAVLFIGLLI